MAKKPLTEKQREYLKPAVDKLDAAFGELQAQLRRLPSDGDPVEPTGCLKCDCPQYKGTFPNACTNISPAFGRPCGHRGPSHSDFM